MNHYTHPQLAIPEYPCADYGLLLVPLTDTPQLLERQQQALQKRYGGSLTRPVHMTCQRFSCTDEKQLTTLKTALTELCAQASLMPVWATELLPFYSEFRAQYVLKCRVYASPSLQQFMTQLETTLQTLDLKAQTPWTPELVTLLEGINASEQAPLPCTQKLFVGQRLVLSRIHGPHAFEPVVNIPLGDDRVTTAA